MENSNVNIIEAITQTINNLFSNLFASIDNSIYSVLDDLLFISPNILQNNNLNRFLGNSNSFIILCNALLLGFTIYYICKLLLSYFTFSQVQKPTQFIYKLLLCTLAINSSRFLIENFILLINTISLAIREIGEILLGQNICLSSLIEKFNSVIYLENIGLNLFSLNGLIKSFVSIGMLNLSISYAIRYIMVKVFILFTPFALASLTNISTSWIFKSWFKILFSLLLLQIFVPIILIVCFSLNFNPLDIFSKITYIGCIYSLIKCNSFIRDFMGGLSTDVNIGISNMKSFLSN